MSFLPDAVRKGLEDSRVAMLRQQGRLCVHAGDDVFRVTRIWDGGFAVEASDAPVLHGYVDLYDGPRHVYRCLVVASHQDDGERVFEFKRNTSVSTQPPVDFERADVRPAGLIEYAG